MTHALFILSVPWMVLRTTLISLLLRWLLAQALCEQLRAHWRRAPAREPSAEDPLAAPMLSAQRRAHPRSKPPWVEREVLRLAVFRQSCRLVADSFNKIHRGTASVGKSWVAELCAAHADELALRRRRMRSALPRPIPAGQAWSVDLCFWRDASGSQQCVLGVIDQGSRVLLRLVRLPRKCAWTLLGHLCLTIAEYGKPQTLRSDNECMFVGRLWKVALKRVGIGHERIQLASPWQNGRIERCFATLKAALRSFTALAGPIANAAAMQQALDEFRCFYNHVRVHQALGGRTPAQAWKSEAAIDPNEGHHGHWVHALQGALIGYHVRR